MLTSNTKEREGRKVPTDSTKEPKGNKRVIYRKIIESTYYLAVVSFNVNEFISPNKVYRLLNELRKQKPSNYCL